MIHAAIEARDGSSERPHGDPEPSSEDHLSPHEDERIRCAACEHPLTSHESAAEVNGTHKHRFMNSNPS